MKTYVLYNPYSDNSNGKAEAEALLSRLNGETEFRDMTSMEPYPAFFSALSPEDEIILCGGDGTLNRFLNDTRDLTYPNRILYFAAGSGSDFWRDLGRTPGDDPVEIGQYIKDLPSVTVNGRTSLFLDNVGFGIDGYCCEVGDRLRAKNPGKKINYAGIAIKGLLFHFKPVSAVVTVDGKEYSYRHVWLAPTMNGRFYGGGMMIAPGQDRLNSEGHVSLVVLHSPNKLKTLIYFPSIFKGEHIRHTDMVEIMTGHEISVRFDRPTALQIDGETVIGVTEYGVQTVTARRAAEKALAAK